MTKQEAQKALDDLDDMAVTWNVWTPEARKAYQRLVRLFVKYGAKV